MDLGGQWQAATSTDDRRRAITNLSEAPPEPESWIPATVPGHWRSELALAASDGPVLYRREFSVEAAGEGRRSFLTFDGIFYQGDVWLDGEYLGDTEGYFMPHSFEVGEQLGARRDHTVTVEVTCSPPADRTAKRNLTGVFQHWDCIDPDWNPGGIWAGVHLEESGAVRIAGLKVLCREATAERALLDIEAILDQSIPGPVVIDTTVTPESGGAAAASLTQESTLAAGDNTVTWRLAVERPQLWWPRALGRQPLYTVRVAVRSEDGAPSDERTVTTGLRQIRMRDFVATVNGERIFLKGANHGPTRRDPAAASAETVRRDVVLAAEAGLDLLRVHAHIARPELYDEADRSGMLLWQDLPLQWGYGRVRRQAVEQARAAVRLLGHHPSIAVWCGHNEPMAIEPPQSGLASGRDVARVVASQVLPTWNKTGLDRSIRRALERADGSRPVVAHSGVVPHPLWGTDTHFYFGWYRGGERDFPGAIARFPVLGRFVSEFGAQAVPESAEFMEPARWPDLDWDTLGSHFCLQKAVFDQRIPPDRYDTFEAWRAATQEYQAELLRHHIETLRTLKYRPAGGFCFFLLADAQPAVTWSVLDYDRVPKAAYQAVRRACQPVIVVATRPSESVVAGTKLTFDIHVVSDLRVALEGAVVEATLSGSAGSRTWRYAGDIAADRCSKVAKVSHVAPADGRGPLSLDLLLRWSGGEVRNHYETTVTSREGT